MRGILFQRLVTLDEAAELNCPGDGSYSERYDIMKIAMTTMRPLN